MDQSAQTPPPVETPAPAAPFRFSPLLPAEMVGRFVDRCRDSIGPGFYHGLAKMGTHIGHWAFLAIAPLGFLLSLIFAIRSNQFSVFVFGVACLVLVPFLQYLAYRFLAVMDALVQAAPTRLMSRAVPDFCVVVHGVGGVFVLIGFLVLAVKTNETVPLWTGLGLFALLEMSAYLALRYELLNVTIDESQRPCEEAPAMLAFALKKFVRMAPVFYGVGAVLAAVFMALATVNAFRGSEYEMQATETGMRGIRLALITGLLPSVLYVVFAVGHMMIELVRAVLSILKPR